MFGLDTADQGIVALEDWFLSIGAPIKLDALNVGVIDNKEVAKNAFLTSKKWGLSDLYSIETISDILDIAR